MDQKPHPRRPLGNGGGSGRSRGLPRLGRRRFRQRADHCCRRRPERSHLRRHRRILIMKKIVLPLLLSAALAHAAPSLPQVYSLHADALAAARDRLAKGDPALAPALERLRADADQALQFKPDGLPYSQHDGKHNPEADRGIDAPAWGHMCSNAETLGLAYYFTHQEAYAEHAALLIRTWFLNPATRMNPNVNFGQYVPGVNEGRGTGLISFRAFTNVCNTLGLIAGSPAWTADDDTAFRAWLADYYTWLTTSRNGRDEAHATNNHGSWYDVQAAEIALFLGKTDAAKKILTDALEKRLATQIMPDGSEPEELRRTKSLGYSLFNVQALCNLSVLAEHVDVDWWGFSTKDGRSLRAALRYLAPYADPAKPWIKNDLVASGRAGLLPLFAEALRHGDDPQFHELLVKFGDSGDQQAARWHLLLNFPPPD